MPTATQSPRTMVRAILPWVTGFLGLSAWGGAVYLLAGAPELDTPPPEFLPGDSWLPGGIALAVFVALPMSIASYALAVGRDGAITIAVAAGVLLMGWIVVQVVILGYVSLLQPAMFVAGALVVLLAALAGRNTSALK